MKRGKCYSGGSDLGVRQDEVKTEANVSGGSDLASE